ncbi:hypothetical protein [Microlunatus speluncae]|uniref:hypothetical protein n=1 Tax=Microlunatus speluncae TaxID=2594267 RepID=UPI0012663602|nr:hypothetical protein [Microlunatus speluncae]
MDHVEVWKINNRAVRKAIRAAAKAGLRGDPDVLRPSRVPEAITTTAIRAVEAMYSKQSERIRASRDRVEFVLANLTRMYETEPVPMTRPVDRAEELVQRDHRRIADLRQRVRQASAQIQLTAEDHAAVLHSIAAAYNQLINNQVAAWKSHHPHREHLTDVAIPLVTVPARALDLGQLTIVRAVRATATELGWLAPLPEPLEGHLPPDPATGDQVQRIPLLRRRRP